ncbi:MAG: methyl-accepting chemotaxis protein [Burkholderiaceae bacterium]
MLSMRNISVRSRFYLVMSLVTISLLVQAGWGMISARSGIQTVTEMFDQADATATQVGALRESMASVRRYQAEMVATAVSNPTGVEPVHQAWKKEIAALNAGGDGLVKAHPGDAALAASVDKQKKLLGEVVEIIDPIAQQLTDAKMDAAAALAYAGQASEKLDAAQANLAAILKSQQAAAAAIRGQISVSSMIASTARLVLVGITLAIFLPLMWMSLRSICGPLDQAVAVATRVASGDLVGRIDTEGQDEPARLMKALAEMQASLKSLVGQVRESSESIEVASSEVASGNTDLSQRTELAASHLQSTASQMEDLTHTVRQSADSAHTANQLASSAAEVAARGGQVVSQVVSTMNDINASSKKISDIIGVIDGIAFQTNILALNAAVEAARAGEQGRGFAVVAGEVRNLAQRSAEAAKEIKSLIGASVERVESGSRLVHDAGTTMTEIVASVQRVTDIIGEISAASTEQSSGIGQVKVAIGEVDQMTQQNAALVEESAAAAESLKEQATKLAAVVSRFKLAEDAAAARAPASSHDSAADQAIARAKAHSVAPKATAPVAAKPLARPAAKAPVAAPAAPSAEAPAPVAVAAAPSTGDGGDWESF